MWSDNIPITDGMGSVTYRKPLAQFDLINEHSGYAPVPIKGIRYWLGTNTGLAHSFVDTTARNGTTYYYAVTAYDHGAPAGGIAPSECSKFISVSTSGAIDKGSNVVIVRPEAPAAGYVEPVLKNIKLQPGGAATGSVSYEIVDARLVKADHKYRITFDDTLTDVSTRLYPVTKCLSLFDITDPANPDTLINQTRDIKPTDKLPMTDGFLLNVKNDTMVTIDAVKTKWSRPDIYGYIFRPTKQGSVSGIANAADYKIEFGEVGIDTSTEYQVSKSRKLDAIPVNFRVFNSSTQKYIDFAFWEKDGSDGAFTGYSVKKMVDVIIFLEKNKADSTIMTWELTIDVASIDSAHNNPVSDDFMTIVTKKPFLYNDVFEFTTEAQHIDAKLAKSDIDNIKVVPNPYVVSNSWEPINPYANGRGPRELHFIHLPTKCTIRIFTIRGQLVDTIEHNTPEILDGTEIWDMQTKDKLDIAYGVYVFHVDAGQLGQKIGKFAVIK
jgi:hypothetical protein